MLEHLFRALTTDGSTDELAGQHAALKMFRDSRRQSHRPRFVSSISMAAAAVVIIGGLAAAAYAAVLPAAVQHLAYRALASIGVPDVHHQSHPSSALAAGPAPSVPTATATACPCRASPSAAAAAQHIVLTAARAEIMANATEVLSGQLARGGAPEPGVRVQLLEQVHGHPGWQPAGGALTNGDGDVSLTVPHLTRNAEFRLTGPAGAASTTVSVTVVPPVSVRLSRLQLAGTRVLTARSRFADVGDEVVLQELSGTTWENINAQVLDQNHRALFMVPVPRSGVRLYRVVLRRTGAHGSSASGQVQVTQRLTPAAPATAGAGTPVK